MKASRECLSGENHCPLVHERAPPVGHGLLEADLIAVHRHALELLMGGYERHRPGGFVDFARLDAHQAVLDDVDAADPLGARPAVQLLDRLKRRDALPVHGDRDAGLEGDDDLVGERRIGRIVRVGVDVLRRAVPDVLEEAGFDGPAPDVLVDGEGVVVRRLDGQVVPVRVVDRELAGHRQIADRGDAGQVGGQRCDSILEPHLVVALARASVGDDGCAEPPGGGDQVLDDHRAGEGRYERIAPMYRPLA